MSEEGITLTVWGNDGMPSDVIEGVERIVVYLGVQQQKRMD